MQEDMSVSVPGSHVLGTFSCTFEPGGNAQEGLVRLRTLNYSEPAIPVRKDITYLTNRYSERFRTVSVFGNIGQGEHEGHSRSVVTQYNGSDYSRFDVGDEGCATLVRGSRLSCSLASSGAEVAFFTTKFPPPPIKARGYFVGARTFRLLKLCMVHPSIQVLPDINQICYPHRLRHTQLSEDKNPYIAPGFLFIHVTPWTNQVPDGDLDLRDVVTDQGVFHVPSALARNVRLLHGFPPPLQLPPHLIRLLRYFHIGEQELVDSYLQELEACNLEQITEILVAAIDVFKKATLRRIFDLFGRKIDEIGTAETLDKYAARLGFLYDH